MPSKVRHIRVPDDVWEGASARAHDDHTTASTVAVAALKEYWRTGTRVGVSSVPEVPADPPAAPVAPPQGQSAPMERSEPPEPRTDPEPTPERKRRVPARRTAKAAQPEPDAHPESTAEAESEGERITAEIESDPDEVARLRHSRQQAREGKAVRWDGPGEPGSLAAAHALAEAVGAPMKMASDLPPAPKPPPAHDPTVPVFQEAGEDAYIPPLLAPDDEERPRKPCRHPASLIRPDGTCECGEEMYS